MKTSDLVGLALDWAVCVAEGNRPVINPVRFGGVSYGMFESELGYAIKRYCTWDQGGPIIERECIATYASGACSVAPKNPDYWVAEILGTEGMITQYGPTPLIAAMRCYVASKLGDEIEIPEELK